MINKIFRNNVLTGSIRRFLFQHSKSFVFGVDEMENIVADFLLDKPADLIALSEIVSSEEYPNRIEVISVEPLPDSNTRLRIWFVTPPSKNEFEMLVDKI